MKKKAVSKTRKATKTPKIKAKIKAKSKLKVMTKKPMGVVRAKKKFAEGADPYAKRIFVRFETPELKELVRKAADATGASLSAYIAAAAVDWAKRGEKLEMRPQAVETAKAS